MESKITIAVVDSGVDKDNSAFDNVPIGGIEICGLDNNGKIKISNNIKDQIGHGTAVCSIITRKLQEYGVKFQLFIVKIFQQEYNEDEQKLLLALRYVLEEVDCNIIHLSLGITACSCLNEMQYICKQLTDKGIIILSAFDNSGAFSYPASFYNVIGVDTCNECNSNDGWIYVENSPVNLLVKQRVFRSAWLNGEKNLVQGSSFGLAVITANIGRIMSDNSCFDPGYIMNNLKMKAERVIEDKKQAKLNNHFVSPEKAMVFPFNKEMHSLRRFEESLPFVIKGYYDVTYSRNVGKLCDEIIGGVAEPNKSIIINDIKKLNWEDDFDTFILGHVRSLENLIKMELRQYIYEQCVRYGKNLFSLDVLPERMYKNQEINIYTPGIYPEDIVKNSFGKLYLIGKPILGVFGTSSKQGKFTLQNEMRARFLRGGYRVGQLGTEPHSELFGYDKVFPMGYNQNINIPISDCVSVINAFLHQIELLDPDIIIIGSQSSTIPYYYGNTLYMSEYQQQLLYASVPDGVLLSINVYDDLDYILRTIKYIESVSKVIAVVVYPITIQNSLGGMSFNKNVADDEDRLKIEKTIGLPAFLLSRKSDMDRLFKLCEDYFSGEGQT